MQICHSKSGKSTYILLVCIFLKNSNCTCPHIKLHTSAIFTNNMRELFSMTSQIPVKNDTSSDDMQIL